jgi:hypothetical protein
LVLLWGDSHAADLYPGLANARSTGAFDLIQWTMAGCPPTVTAMAGEFPWCDARRTTVMKKLTQIRPDIVLLAGAWERYQELGRSPGELLPLVDEAIHYLKRRGIQRIVVFGPGPLWHTSLPVDLFRSMVRLRSNHVPERLGTVQDAIWRLDDSMARQAADDEVRYVSVLRYFCDKSGCLTVGDRQSLRPDLLFRDRDHLSVSGSRALIEHEEGQLFGRTLILPRVKGSNLAQADADHSRGNQ